MTDQNKNYNIEFNEDEAEKIGNRARDQGISTPDFITYCVRSICFGINYAVRQLAESAQAGTREKD